MVSRRDALFATIAAAGGTLALKQSAEAAQRVPSHKGWDARYSGPEDAKAQPPAQPGTDYSPVWTPNGSTLPFTVVDGVKVFHLTAEEVDHEFTPGFRAKCWGYNGAVHGPTLEVAEGDRVRIYVTNKLPAATTVHWHGVFLPNGMDGVGGLTQPVIRPGETYRYEWTFKQHGTFMYHSHHDEMTQMALGLMGMIVVHPRKPSADYRVDHDVVMMLSEWLIPIGASRPNPNAMSEFNVLTINARVFPGTAPIVCKQGDRIRIRIGNLSAMDHHAIHLHGHYFRVTATDGGHVPDSAQFPEGTVLVSVGSTRDIEFVADALGDWPLHCHMTHHVMNQMGHGLPNLIGINGGPLGNQVQKLVPGYMDMGSTGMDMEGMQMQVPKNSIPMAGGPGQFGGITMGGMFTVLKVRETIGDRTKDPGWYKHPEGTVARKATAEELAKDGIVLKKAEPKTAEPKTAEPKKTP